MSDFTHLHVHSHYSLLDGLGPEVEVRSGFSGEGMLKAMRFLMKIDRLFHSGAIRAEARSNFTYRVA